MHQPIAAEDVDRVGADYRSDPSQSLSLHADAYTEPAWFDFERNAVFARSWQWVCHAEKLAEPGAYVSADVAGQPILVIRGSDGELRAFYNVCKHRAHQIVAGEGSARALTCGYHGWVYDLKGSLVSARHTAHTASVDTSGICLSPVQAEEFSSLVFVNLDPSAEPLSRASGGLADELAAWAPDLAELTHAKRLSYDIAANWKGVIDNFLECYHCHIAHRDFVSLVDMDTYTVTTHGIYSSHMASAGKTPNSAYATQEATVTDHAVWWLWPNTCMMRYPGRGNFIVLHVIPAGPGRTLETYDFFLEDPEPSEAELDAIRYIDDVLQPEDIALVESVQRGMGTPAFDSGPIVVDPERSGLSEHGLHHFHGLLLDSYRAELSSSEAFEQ